ncbi:protein-tyrosine phosphatase-like protein, partial [Dimargaris cristalligena]
MAKRQGDHHSSNVSPLSATGPTATASITATTNSPLRFLITDCPTHSNLNHYLEVFQTAGVTDVVRVCDSATYPAEVLERAGIRTHHWHYPDGLQYPPNRVIRQWFQLVRERAHQAAEQSSTTAIPSTTDSSPPLSSLASSSSLPTLGGMTIAIHCVSGLGRAPLLVTMALVANGMAPATAIELVRRKRRGALTIEQVDYLMGYADRLCP